MFENFKNRVHNVIDNASGKVIGVVGGLVASTGSAYAAVPATVTDAIDGAITDGSSLAWALVGLAVVVGVIFFLKRKAG